jgi:hypothetical protein
MGMNSIFNAIGSHVLVLPGVLIAVLAGAALMLWEYLRLSGSSGRFRYLVAVLPRVRLFAISLTVLSVVLILFRFIGVER